MYTVVLPIGGSSTFRSGRVTSSGKIPPVSVKRILPQLALLDTDALGDAGQIPHRLHRHFGDHTSFDCVTILPSIGDAAGVDGLNQFRNGKVRLGNRDRRTDAVSLVEIVREILDDARAPGIDGHDLVGIASRNRKGRSSVVAWVFSRSERKSCGYWPAAIASAR